MYENSHAINPEQEEPFALPDVVFCPSAGDGCNDKDGQECSRELKWFMSSLKVSTWK